MNYLSRSRRKQWTIVPFALALFLGMGAGSTVVADAPSATVKEAMRLGLEAGKRKDWKAAIKHFDKAREEARHTPQILFNLALAYDSVGGRDFAAIAFYRAFLAVAPNSRNAERIRKRISELTEKMKGVVVKLIDVAEKMAKEFPVGIYERSGALKAVAAAHAMNGDMTSAQAIVENELEERYREGAYYTIATYLAIAGKFSDARNTAKLVKNRGFYASIYGNIAGWQAMGGDVRGAMESAAQIESLTGNTESERNSIMSAQSEAYSRIGDRLLENGDIEGAKTMVTKAKRAATAISPKKSHRGNIFSPLLTLWVRTGDVQGALRFVETLDAGSSLRDDAFNSVAYALTRAGEIEQARRTLARATKVNPNIQKWIDTIEKHRKAAHDATDEEQRRAAEQWLRRGTSPLGRPLKATLYYTGLSLPEKEAYSWAGQVAPVSYPRAGLAVDNLEEYIRGLLGDDSHFRADRITGAATSIMNRLNFYRQTEAEYQALRRQAKATGSQK
ncbi:MAG: hypothetical protein HQ512_10080 [Rhodospirillales bacterium]|nr:hypothetical protein [Rhodospirillales bacterium]